MKKKLTAIILILSIVASLFAVSAISSSAAAKRNAPSYFEVSKESNGFGISWGRVPGATHYCLYMGYNNSWQAWRIISASNYENYLRKYGHYPIYEKTLYTENVWHTPHSLNHGYAPKLIIGQQYCFQINSCNANGGNLGKWSKVAKQTFAPSPTTLKGNFTSDKKLRIYWNRIPGADDYQLSRYNSAKGTWSVVAYTKECSYVDKAVSPGVWTYRIRARAQTLQGQTACGKWSNNQKMQYFPKIDLLYANVARKSNKKYVYDINWLAPSNTPVTIRFYADKKQTAYGFPDKKENVTGGYLRMEDYRLFRCIEICYLGNEDITYRWIYELPNP